MVEDKRDTYDPADVVVTINGERCSRVSDGEPVYMPRKPKPRKDDKREVKHG